MKDLQIAIADYYASKKESVDPQISLKPSVQTLPETGNSEGDTRLQTSDNTYYLYDGGIWNALDTGNNDSDLEFASDSELLEMLKAGEEEARG